MRGPVGRLLAAAAFGLACAPAPVAAQGFFDLYRSVPRAETVSAPAARSGLAPMRADLSASLIPSLSQVESGSVPDMTGENTFIPSLGENFAAAARAAAAAPSAGGDMGVCIASIRAAEKRHGIPENLLMAIGLQEAGRERNGQMTIWPWSINSHGKTHMFDTKAEAIAFVRAEKAAGKTLIDTGCLQVNQRWHPDAFASLEEAFDPDASAEYAARFLARLKEDAGDWMTAAGNYHSFTPQHHNRYLAGIRKNLEVALAFEEDFTRLASASGAPRGFAPTLAVATGPVLGHSRGVSLAGGKGYMRTTEALPERVASLSPPPLPAPPRERETGAWWSSESGGTTEARSIYSRNALRPVLPVLTE